MITCGDTFLLEDEDGHDQHLCIVVTPPSDDRVVIVSVTTRRSKSEALVILNPLEHPFIKNESVIAYTYSRVINVEDIENAVKNRDASKRESATEVLLRRAQSGLLESEFTPYGVLAFYKSIMNS